MSQPLTLRTDSGDEHLDLHEFEARSTFQGYSVQVSASVNF